MVHVPTLVIFIDIAPYFLVGWLICILFGLSHSVLNFYWFLFYFVTFINSSFHASMFICSPFLSRTHPFLIPSLHYTPCSSPFVQMSIMHTHIFQPLSASFPFSSFFHLISFPKCFIPFTSLIITSHLSPPTILISMLTKCTLLLR